VDLMPPASPLMDRMWVFNVGLFIVIGAIVAFVLGLLVYVMWRFNAGRNPTPSKRSHNTAIEIVWTAIPALILIGIGIPSFRLLYYLDHVPEAEFTIKATGHQWYWTHSYPDHGDFSFDSFVVADEDLTEGQPRLLATDRHVVLPVDTTVRVLVTSEDVIHAWAVPSFGAKIDAVPGRLNETWVRATREGTYYGQCSELCGVNHGFMPVTIEVVSKAAFAEWVEKAKVAYAPAGAALASAAGE